MVALGEPGVPVISWAGEHRRSTREADKKRALAVAQQCERIAKRQGSPQRVRQVFSEFYREHYGQDIPLTSVADYASQWLSARFLGSHAQRGLDDHCSRDRPLPRLDSGHNLGNDQQSRLEDRQDVDAVSAHWRLSLRGPGGSREASQKRDDVGTQGLYSR